MCLKVAWARFLIKEILNLCSRWSNNLTKTDGENNNQPSVHVYVSVVSLKSHIKLDYLALKGRCRIAVIPTRHQRESRTQSNAFRGTIRLIAPWNICSVAYIFLMQLCTVFAFSVMLCCIKFWWNQKLRLSPFSRYFLSKKGRFHSDAIEESCTNQAKWWPLTWPAMQYHISRIKTKKERKKCH